MTFKEMWDQFWASKTPEEAKAILDASAVAEAQGRADAYLEPYSELDVKMTMSFYSQLKRITIPVRIAGEPPMVTRPERPSLYHIHDRRKKS